MGYVGQFPIRSLLFGFPNPPFFLPNCIFFCCPFIPFIQFHSKVICLQANSPTLTPFESSHYRIFSTVSPLASIFQSLSRVGFYRKWALIRDWASNRNKIPYPFSINVPVLHFPRLSYPYLYYSGKSRNIPIPSFSSGFWAFPLNQPLPCAMRQPTEREREEGNGGTITQKQNTPFASSFICWAHQPAAGRSPLLASSHSHSRQPPPHLLICPLNRPSFLVSAFCIAFSLIYVYFFPSRKGVERGRQHVKRPKNGTTLDYDKSRRRRRIRKGSSNIWEAAQQKRSTITTMNVWVGGGWAKGPAGSICEWRERWLAGHLRARPFDHSPKCPPFPFPSSLPTHLSRFGAKIRVGDVVLVVVTKIARDLNDERRHRATS